VWIHELRAADRARHWRRPPLLCPLLYILLLDISLSDVSLSDISIPWRQENKLLAPIEGPQGIDELWESGRGGDILIASTRSGGELERGPKLVSWRGWWASTKRTTNKHNNKSSSGCGLGGGEARVAR